MMVAVFLIVRLRQREGKDLTRVLIDDHAKAADGGAGR